MRRATMQVIVAVLVGLSAGSILAAAPEPAPAPLPIRIGYQSNVDWLLFVARDLKLFEKAGLAPTWEKFVAGAPMIEAAQGRSIDVLDVGAVPFLVGLSKGVEWTMIGVSSEQAYAEGVAVRRDRGIAAFGDLKGKRIGFFRGSTAHYGLVMALRQQGIRLDQVTLLHMTPAEQLAALASGDIDAAMVWEPWLQRMDHEANARILATEGDFGIYASVSAFAARRDWLRENREAAVRFLEALLMAYDVVKKDRGIGIRALAGEVGIKEAWVKDIYEEAPPPNLPLWTDPAYRYSLAEGSDLQRRLEYIAMFLVEGKFIPREVEDISDAMDASVIADALKRRKKD